MSGPSVSSGDADGERPDGRASPSTCPSTRQTCTGATRPGTAVEVESHNGFAGTVNLTADGPAVQRRFCSARECDRSGRRLGERDVHGRDRPVGDRLSAADGFTLRGQSPNASNPERVAGPARPADTGNFRRPQLAHDRFDLRRVRGGHQREREQQRHVRRARLRPAGALAPPLRVDAGLPRRGRDGHLPPRSMPACPVSIFNFGFDSAIADGPGSRHNLGTATWNHNHFKVSPDGSYLIAVAQSATFNASLSRHAQPLPGAAASSSCRSRRRSGPASWTTG